MYETAEASSNKIRLRLHIGLKSSVMDLQDDVIRFLNTTTEVNILYCILECTVTLFSKGRLGVDVPIL